MGPFGFLSRLAICNSRQHTTSSPTSPTLSSESRNYQPQAQLTQDPPQLDLSITSKVVRDGLENSLLRAWDNIFGSGKAKNTSAVGLTGGIKSQYNQPRPVQYLQAIALMKEERDKAQFKTDFPRGFQLMITEPSNFLCGLHALYVSLTHQLHQHFPPAISDLECIATTIEVALARTLTRIGKMLEHSLQPFHLAIVLLEWGYRQGLNLQLGIHSTSSPSYILRQDQNYINPICIWIHDEYSKNENGSGIGRYWGMKGIPLATHSVTSTEALSNGICEDERSTTSEIHEQSRLVHIASDTGAQTSATEIIDNLAFEPTITNVPREVITWIALTVFLVHWIHTDRRR